MVKVMDHTCSANPEPSYENSGIAAAARKAGADVTYIDNRRFQEFSIPGGKVLKYWDFYKEMIYTDLKYALYRLNIFRPTVVGGPMVDCPRSLSTYQICIPEAVHVLVRYLHKALLPLSILPITIHITTLVFVSCFIRSATCSHSPEMSIVFIIHYQILCP